ncbi:MAG: hypothetical protein L0I29_12925 [Hyphomicrobiales bacterium]|nr:hypothetical protein [Hyphomicrobiales bacterium]
MRLKLIMMVASVGLIGAAISGCVSEGGHYRSDYRPAAYQTHTRHVDHRRDRDSYRAKNVRQSRNDSSHRSNDRDRHYNKHRDRTSGHYKDCRPGTKDCRRPHR